jgi:hypothetical protein
MDAHSVLSISYPSLGAAHIVTAEAAKIGFHSGKEKLRLKLDNDINNKFAVAILNDQFKNPQNALDEWCRTKQKKWIPLNYNGGTVKAEISSVARRLGLTSKDAVINLVNEGKLETEILQHLKEYKRDLSDVQNVIEKIKEFFEALTDASISPEDIYIIQEDIKDEINGLAAKIHDPQLNELCTVFAKRCQRFEPGKPHFDNIKKERNLFLSKLPWMANTITTGAPPRERITQITKKKDLGQKTLSFGKAMTLARSPGEAAARLHIMEDSTCDDKGKFAIKTDGYLYYTRPKADRYHVPYSEDGKEWVLLNIQSLSKRTSLTPKEIRNRAEWDLSGENLKTLIDNQMKKIIQGQQEFSKYFAYAHQLIQSAELAVNEKSAAYKLPEGEAENSDWQSSSIKPPKGAFSIDDEIHHSFTQPDFVDQDLQKTAMQFEKKLRAMEKKFQQETDLLGGSELKDLLLEEFDRFRKDELWFIPVVAHRTY